MRKWIWIESILLVILLAVAVVMFTGLRETVMVPLLAAREPVQTTAATQATTAQTEAPTTETTVFTEPTETTEPYVLPEITWKTIPDDRELTCSQAFVYDCYNEKYMFMRGDAKDRVYPASITKLMSIHVACQYLDPTWELTAGSVLNRVMENASIANLQYGDVMTVEMLMEGMLLPSGNDAAYMIATEAGREIAGNSDLGVEEAIEVFVKEMNRQAQELGMTGTQYKNPDGWHNEDHFTNFDDLVTVAKLALQNETVLKYACVGEETVTPVQGEPKEWKNTNFLVNAETEYYCPYAIGLKTGQTSAAGSCLLSAFDLEGRVYIIGVFGSTSFHDRLDDTLQILNSVVMQSA